MEKILFSEFMAEIESIFQSYAETNDIDRISVKGWVIDKLRGFGKNICETREAVMTVENSKVLLPENFKSLILALKVEGEIYPREERFTETPFKKYVTNDVVYDSVSMEYIKNSCQSQIIIESLIQEKEYFGKYMDVFPLSLVKGIQKNSLDVDCYNIHPSIRNTYPHQINITNRTINANFKKGLIYVKYNSLPSDEDGEIAIPILTTSDIYRHILLDVKIRIVENLLINNRNAESLKQLLQLWLPQLRQSYIEAKSEANFFGLKKGWEKEMYNKNRQNQNRYNLPK